MNSHLIYVTVISCDPVFERQPTCLGSPSDFCLAQLDEEGTQGGHLNQMSV